jgi:hypothetical protein
MKRIAVLVLALAVTGCASATYQVHPGAGGYVSGAATGVQLFASQSYDTLTGWGAAIQSARASFLANPATLTPTVKTAFNVAVKAYDDAQAAWIAFNQAAATNPSASQDALAAALAGATTAFANLTIAKGN